MSAGETQTPPGAVAALDGRVSGEKQGKAGQWQRWGPSPSTDGQMEAQRRERVGALGNREPGHSRSREFGHSRCVTQ